MQPFLQWIRNITYSESVFVALVCKSACAILSSVACPSLQNFCTFSHKRRDFRKKSYRTQNVGFGFLYNNLRNSSHSKKNWARYKCIL